MKKEDLKKIIKEQFLFIIDESIDLTNITEINGFNELIVGNHVRFTFVVQNRIYLLDIPISKSIIGIQFGVYDEETNTIDVETKINSGGGLKTLSYVFSIILYALKKFNIKN